MPARLLRRLAVLLLALSATACPRRFSGWEPIIMRTHGQALVRAYTDASRSRKDLIQNGTDYLELTLESLFLEKGDRFAGSQIALGLEVRGLLGGEEPLRNVIALRPKAGKDAFFEDVARVHATPFLGRSLTISLLLRELRGEAGKHAFGAIDATADVTRYLDPIQPEAISAGTRKFSLVLGASGSKANWVYSFTLYPADGLPADKPEMLLTATRHVLFLLPPAALQTSRLSPSRLRERLRLQGNRLVWRRSGRNYRSSSYVVLKISRFRRHPRPRALLKLANQFEGYVTRGHLNEARQILGRLGDEVNGARYLTERERSLERALSDLRKLRIEATAARQGRQFQKEEKFLLNRLRSAALVRRSFGDILRGGDRKVLDRTVATIASRSAAIRRLSRLLDPDLQKSLASYRRGTAAGDRGLIPPAAPELINVAPKSPSRGSTAVTVTARADASDSIRLYRGANCDGPVLVMRQAAEGSEIRLPVRVTENAVTLLSAEAVGPGGVTSACSREIRYVHDNQPPAPATLASTVPRSPSPKSTGVRLLGSAEAGATLSLHASPKCTGPALATAKIAKGGKFDLKVPVRANATSTFAAVVVDEAGNRSPCSAPIEFLHDNVAPAAPVLSATEPKSPASSSDSPVVVGKAEAGAKVLLYAAANCAGPAKETMATAAGFRAAMKVAANATTQLSARAVDAAGNRSECSPPLAFVHDAQPPAAPVLSGSMPPSPGSASRPAILGKTEAAATVTFYPTPNCTGAALANVQANAEGAFSAPVPVAANQTTVVAAAAVDAAGNRSPCSAAFSFVHDDRPPPAPILTAMKPKGPSPESAPTVTGTAEIGATVEIHSGEGCSGTALARKKLVGSGAFTLSVSVPPNRSTMLRAVAVDAAGNRSGCSAPMTYVHDDTPPTAPRLIATEPRSPAKSDTPTVVGHGESGSRIEVFSEPGCKGKRLAQVNATSEGGFRVSVTVDVDEKTTLFANAVDLAGNRSSCTPEGLTYVHRDPDVTKPAGAAAAKGKAPATSASAAKPAPRPPVGSAENDRPKTSPPSARREAPPAGNPTEGAPPPQEPPAARESPPSQGSKAPPSSEGSGGAESSPEPGGKAPPPQGEPPPAKGEPPPAKGEAPPPKGEAPPQKRETPPPKGEAPPSEGSGQSGSEGGS